MVNLEKTKCDGSDYRTYGDGLPGLSFHWWECYITLIIIIGIAARLTPATADPPPLALGGRLSFFVMRPWPQDLIQTGPIEKERDDEMLLSSRS